MTINFSRGVSQIGFRITVPEGIRKNHRQVKIPALEGYKVLRMIDEGFREQRQLWAPSGQYLVLDAKKLPASESYMIVMEGSIDEKVLKDFVYIKPAANRDNDDENDRYWLESSIRKPTVLEKIYADLEIDDVNVGVVVNIDKMFGLTIPKEVQEKAIATTELLQASSSKFDRNRLFRAAVEYRKQERISPTFDPVTFFKTIQRLTAREVIRQHINIEQPYDIGNIDQPSKYQNIIPQSINVQTVTRLTLRTPIANGYLTFNREKYMDKLRTEFKKLV